MLTFSFNCPLIDAVEFLHVKGKDNENGGGWGRWLTLGTGIVPWDAWMHPYLSIGRHLRKYIFPFPRSPAV